MGQRVAASATHKHMLQTTLLSVAYSVWLICPHMLDNGPQLCHCAAGYKAPTGAPSLAGTVLTVVENTDQASRLPALFAAVTIPSMVEHMLAYHSFPMEGSQRLLLTRLCALQVHNLIVCTLCSCYPVGAVL